MYRRGNSLRTLYMKFNMRHVYKSLIRQVIIGFISRRAERFKFQRRTIKFLRTRVRQAPAKVLVGLWTGGKNNAAVAHEISADMKRAVVRAADRRAKVGLRAACQQLPGNANEIVASH